MGYYTHDGLPHYAGRAGTGITDKELKRLTGVLKPLAVPKMPLAEPPPRESRFGAPLQLSNRSRIRGSGRTSRLDGWLSVPHPPRR
jgi:hypothetical protein